mmetsp:Transcript_34130/g.91062  ORF Transcript_34130/g.91062 Transcript_34130/m.91062 type:complete len:309 (-) Transcript_34130:109-1035(-)
MASFQGAFIKDQQYGQLPEVDYDQSQMNPAAREIVQTLKDRDFWVLTLLPFSCFFVTVLIWTYFMMSAEICIIWSIVGELACVFLLTPAARQRFRVSVPLGIMCLPAFLLGSLVGSYLFDGFAIFPHFYQNSRTYTNVVPSQPAAAVSDAGKLTFTAESYADVENSISYQAENGVKYCVAPIHDGGSISTIQFWAVGINCCDQVGGFTCDDAITPGVHSGARIFDSHGWFKSANFVEYERARSKAESEYGLPKGHNPIYVRWLTEANLNKVSSHYSQTTVLYGFLISLGYFMLSCVLSYSLTGQPKRA